MLFTICHLWTLYYLTIVLMTSLGVSPRLQGHGKMDKVQEESGPTRRWLGREEGRRATASAAVLPPLASGTTAEYQERYYRYKYRHYYRTTPNAYCIVNGTWPVPATYYRWRRASFIRARPPVLPPVAAVLPLPYQERYYRQHPAVLPLPACSHGAEDPCNLPHLPPLGLDYK